MPDGSSPNLPSTPQNGRDSKGRWLPGHTPGGAKPWQPGQSGNPTGRQSFGAYISEWLNSMAEWTEPELVAVAQDPEAPSAKVAAAQRVLSARKSGQQASADFDRCCDRTTGKPSQSLQIEPSRDTRPVQERAAELLADLRRKLNITVPPPEC